MKNKVVKILATLGLIVAIALILRGVFGVGKIGFKNFSSKLPILKCEIYDTDGSKKIEFYDLEQIKNDDPTQNMSKEKIKELFSRRNLEMVEFTDSIENEYRIRFIYYVDGISKGYRINIKKDSGKMEAWFPEHHSVDASFSEILDAVSKAKIFEGECNQVKRKNL
jgi:hypothetical protein